MKRVSVIISVYSKKRYQYLLNCIDSLRRQSVKPYEVIVVLDPDSDLIDFFGNRLSNDVRIVVSDGYGLSNARNAGVKNAKGSIVAFIDDDAVADRDWLLNILKNYDTAYVVGVGGLIIPLWESSRPIWFPEELDWVVGCSYKGLSERKAFVRNPIGCNMSFRKEIFEKVGYFRSDVGRFGKRLLAGEEPELCIRIFEKYPNLKIVYEPSAVVYHKVDKKRATLRYLWNRCFNEGLSKSLIINPKRNSIEALSTENQYLKYLLTIAIPSRLKRIYKFKNLCHLTILLLSSFAVFIGFLVGKFWRTTSANNALYTNKVNHSKL